MCGFTKQYDALEKVYQNYKGKGLVIIGVPSNSFKQEYNSEERISSYVGLQHNGFELGLVTGYTYADVVPMVRYKKDNWFFAPALEKDCRKGFVIGLEF